MLRSSFLVNLEVCRLIATLQLYYRMNSFTGIFQQRFKLPPCFEVGPHPPSNFDVPLPSQRGGGGGAQPHLMFATPMGNLLKRSIFLLWLYVF